MKKSVFLSVAAAIALWSGTATAQESNNRVAGNTDWSVFTEPSPKECWAVTEPKETVNTRGGQVVDVRRSEILLMVFFRPTANVAGQVAFTGGYSFANGRNISLDIDGRKFEMVTKGEWAWPASPADDARVLAAMKRGKSAKITAQSARGTTTNDTFSLLGVTAAVDEAARQCG